MHRHALALVVLAAALCACQERAPSGAKLTLRPATFGELDGWSDDNVAAAIPAFLKSCKAFAARADDQPLDPATSGDFGTVGEWRAVCAAAEQLPGTDAAAKDFFTSGFVPLLAGKGGGQLKQGRHVRYAKETPINNLWVALLQRMGVKIQSLGDSTGVLAV